MTGQPAAPPLTAPAGTTTAAPDLSGGSALAPGTTPDAAAATSPAGGTTAATPSAAAGGRVAPSADTRPATAILSPPEVALRAGQSAGVALLLVGARDVQSVDVTLVYDATLVQVSDVTPGALLTLDGAPIQTERQLEAGRARVRFARATGASGSGAVAAVTLQGLKAGSGTIAVESLVIGTGVGHGEAGGAGAGRRGGGAVRRGTRRSAMPSQPIRAAAGRVARRRSLTATCDKVPLTAPAGSTIFLQANPPFVVANGGQSRSSPRS